MSALDTARRFCQAEQEAPSELSGREPSNESWPSVGNISFREVCLPASEGESLSFRISVASCCGPFDCELRRALGCFKPCFV
jgi:hypothetical protein